jgi:hypothetical protein
MTKIERRYLDMLVTSKCGADLLSRKLYPNAKEVTEAYSCFDATSKLKLPWGDSSRLAVVVGDGSTPRLGAMVAMRTAWTVASIDPKLKQRDWRVKRLACYSVPIELVRCHLVGTDVCIFMPHSHAPVVEVLKNITTTGQRTLITQDCCVRQLVDGVAPDFEYRDPSCWSPENVIRIWRNV